MKDERTRHGASEQQICVSMLILCIVRKTGPIFLPLVGLMAGKQAGRKAEEIQVDLENF